MSTMKKTGAINLTHPAEPGEPAEKLATIHVLVLWEDEAWCAIALELGIRSYGDSIIDAFNALQEAVGAQGTFAIEQHVWDQIFTPAEKQYIDLYFEAALEEVQGAVTEFEDAPIRKPASVESGAVEGSIDLSALANLRQERPTYEAIV